MNDAGHSSESARRTTHRGIHWYRDEQGNVSFYDESGSQWIRWAPGKDAPPLPPKWQMLGVPTRVTRPGWRSRWRIIPVVLVLAAVVIAVMQALLPSSDNTAKEQKASAALLGKCLAGNHHGGLSADPVPCTSAKAVVRVIQVLPGTPGSPSCRAPAQPVVLAYSGVRYLHKECVVRASPTG